MSFDFTKTLALIKGGLLEREATWNDYFQDCPDWKATAMALTGPLILANIVLGTILGRLTGGFTPYGYYNNFLSALFFSLILACLGLLIAVFVFNTLAGVFKGKSNFARAFAAVSLAAIPSWLAGIVAAMVPGFIGTLFALAGGITSLVFMYKIMPLALDVPNDKRVVHFIASLVAIMVLNVVVGGILGGATLGNSGHSNVFETRQSGSSTASGSGVFGEIARQGQLMDAASADEFEPPADGKLDKNQVRAYVKVMGKTRAMHEEYAQKMDKLGKEMDEKEKRGDSFSLSDLTQAYSGIGGAMGASNAEMEIVKTGGGNWAEHSWVKNQLRTARIQRGDGTDAIAHNYELYKQFEEEIGDL